MGVYDIGDLVTILRALLYLLKAGQWLLHACQAGALELPNMGLKFLTV